MQLQLYDAGRREYSQSDKTWRNKLQIISVYLFNKNLYSLIQGGLAQNLVPAEFTAVFDLRLTTSTDPKEFENMIVKWLAESEEGETDSGTISYEFLCVSSLLKHNLI